MLLLNWNRYFAQTVAREQGRVFSIEIVNALENVVPSFPCLRTCCDSFIWCASLLVTLLKHIMCYTSSQGIYNRRAHQSFFLYKIEVMSPGAFSSWSTQYTRQVYHSEHRLWHIWVNKPHQQPYAACLRNRDAYEHA